MSFNNNTMNKIELLRKIENWFKTTNFKALSKQAVKSPVFWARFVAYAIPLSFLLYVLYINFLPFGYNKTFIIDVGSSNDTKVSEFYLEPSKDLSERKIAKDGTAYRELNGTAKVVFKPKVVLKDAQITISTEDEGISIIPPYINLNPDSIDWDYSWDFTKEVPKDLINKADKVFYFDGNTYFDGSARLEMPESADIFENGPFTIYAEWMPIDSENDFQQIIGHFNWELWQNKNTIDFRIGRMNDNEGPFYSIEYPITEEFFNKKHTAIAIYNPSDNGYIEFFVDNNLAGRKYFGSDKIWKDYGNQNLSFGWTPHNYGKSPYFSGYIHKTNIIEKNILSSQSKISFKTNDNDLINISLISTATSTLKQIKLNANQK